jgi:hypothetical protein
LPGPDPGGTVARTVAGIDADAIDRLLADRE